LSKKKKKKKRERKKQYHLLVKKVGGFVNVFWFEKKLVKTFFLIYFLIAIDFGN